MYYSVMECSGVEALVGTWESGGKAEAAALAAARDHVAACGECRARFATLLAFVERDSVEGAAPLLRPLPLPPGFSDRVIGGIEERRRSGALPFGDGRRGLRFIGIAAAVALFLVGVGFGARVLVPSRGDSVSVLFVLDAPQAKSVSLVGDFNRWNPAIHVLKRRDPSQPWELKVNLPRGKMYVYDFVIDGKHWVPDPSVETKVDDGFGGSGSLLRL